MTQKGVKGRVLSEIWGWTWRLLLAVVIAQAVHLLIFQPVSVKGESMMDTLKNGEIMYVSKPEYLLGDPSRGDVVICRYPGRQENFVKRVIGLPGEVVEIRQGTVYIDGEPLDEPYLAPERNGGRYSIAPFTLGEDEYFVAGDNRDNSHDSRNYYGAGRPAAIARSDIIGHVRFVMWPLGSARGIE